SWRAPRRLPCARSSRARSGLGSQFGSGSNAPRASPACSSAAVRRSTVTGNRAHALPRTVPSDLVLAALITGGSSGIGRAIAEDLAAAGLGISIASRDPERAGLAGAHPIAVDLSDPTTASGVV